MREPVARTMRACVCVCVLGRVRVCVCVRVSGCFHIISNVREPVARTVCVLLDLHLYEKTLLGM